MMMYNHVTYPKNAVVQLAPGPGRMRIAHRFAVEHSMLALILILTSLVASDLRDSYNKDNIKKIL